MQFKCAKASAFDRHRSPHFLSLIRSQLRHVIVRTSEHVYTLPSFQQLGSCVPSKGAIRTIIPRYYARNIKAKVKLRLYYSFVWLFQALRRPFTCERPCFRRDPAVKSCKDVHANLEERRHIPASIAAAAAAAVIFTASGPIDAVWAVSGGGGEALYNALIIKLSKAFTFL